MKFVFDRCVARAHARALNEYDKDNILAALDDDPRFKPTSKDVDIIEILSSEKPKPVFVTSDLNMKTKHPHERKALAGSGLTLVFLTKGFNSVEILVAARRLYQVWPRIVSAVKKCKSPTVFDVKLKGEALRNCGLTKDF